MSKTSWLLLALCVFFVAASAAWTVINSAPPQWDDSWYLANSLVMYDALVDHGVGGYLLRFLTILRIKPPLITVLPTPFYLLLGRRMHAAFAVNLAAMLAVFAVLYMLGRRFQNRRVGIAAIYIAGTMPLLYGLPHWFLVEFALAAFVCVTVYLTVIVIESPCAVNMILLGMVCGLGILLKTTYPLYVSPVILYGVAKLFRERRLRWAPLAALILPAVLIPLPWYAANFRQAIARVVFSSFDAQAANYGTGPVFSVSTIAEYLLIVINRCCSSYYVLLSCVLLVYLAATRKLQGWWNSWSKEARLLLALWALPFVAFLFGRAKDIKYLAPILPVAILLIASLLDWAMLHSRGWRRGLALLLLAFPLAAFLHTSFGVWPRAHLAAGRLAFLDWELGYARVYRREYWPHRAIVERIATRVPKTVMVGTDFPEFNANNLELAAVLGRMPLSIESGAYESDRARLLAQLDATGYFVYKDGGWAERGPFDQHRQALIAYVHEGGFRELMPAIPLPDGGVARIFENTGSGGPLLSAAFIRAGAERLDPIQVSLGDQIELDGLACERLADRMEIRLRWRCLRTPAREYRCFVHILDKAGNTIGHADHWVVAGQPSMLTWAAGDGALETVSIPLAAISGNPDRVRLGLFDEPSGDRLPITIRSGPGLTTTDGGTALVRRF